jgi:hypothetical protein
MRLAAPGCLAETCTDSPSNIWIENSSRNSNKSLLGRNYFSMRFKGAESRIQHHFSRCWADFPSGAGNFHTSERNILARL